MPTRFSAVFVNGPGGRLIFCSPECLRRYFREKYPLNPAVPHKKIEENDALGPPPICKQCFRVPKSVESFV